MLALILLANIQLMSKVRADQFPSYQTAGYKKQIKDQSSAVCLQPPVRDVQTPIEINKFRKSYKEQHGVTIRHYGTINDPLPGQTFTYGVATQKSEGAGNIMKASQKDYVNHYVNEIKESKYDSLKREPLGKTITRNYNYPQVVQNGEFKFGLPTEDNKYGAKQTLYSAENMPEEQLVRQMYLKSHKDYDPGEQKKRPYNWNVDPTDFRFGQVAKNIIHDEIKQILSPESNTDTFPQTRFVKSNLNDFLDKNQDKLGKSMNLGQKQFSSDRVFGVRIEPNQWDAGKCLKGEANEHEVRVDDDLGKSNRHGFRNFVKEGDQNRVFGVSTIRYDIKKPERQSMADPNNYADETTAIQLLFPKEFSSFGVGAEDFDKSLPKQEIRQVFENIGFQFKENIFEALFSRAKVIQGTILDRVSCNSFKKSIYQMCS